MMLIPDYAGPAQMLKLLRRRWLIAGVTGVVLVLSIDWYHLPRMRLAWVQRACLRYRHPPHQPVFIQQDVELLPTWDAPCSMSGPEWGSAVAAPSHHPDRTLATSFHQPRPYRQFIELASSPSRGSPEGVLFLHRRRVPGYDDRLVIVGVCPEPSYGLVAANPDAQHGFDDTLELSLWAEVYSAGRFGGSASLKHSAYLPLNLGSTKRWQKLLIYGGIPDPADPARLTIRYTLDGREGTLEAWLQADDTVVIRERCDK